MRNPSLKFGLTEAELCMLLKLPATFGVSRSLSMPTVGSNEFGFFQIMSRIVYLQGEALQNILDTCHRVLSEASPNAAASDSVHSI
jgi:hypothetical protein